jgi:hypothetical protein
MQVVREINGQRVVGTLLPAKLAPKKPTVRPRPQKPEFGPRIPKRLEF